MIHRAKADPTKSTKAAFPGWSNHQRGKAFDIEAYDLKTEKRVLFETSSGANAFSWMHENAPKYGITWGEEPTEPWHWNFDINRAPPIQSGAASEPDTPSDDGQSFAEGGIEEEPLDQEQSVEAV